MTLSEWPKYFRRRPKIFAENFSPGPPIPRKFHNPNLALVTWEPKKVRGQLPKIFAENFSGCPTVRHAVQNPPQTLPMPPNQPRKPGFDRGAFWTERNRNLTDFLAESQP